MATFIPPRLDQIGGDALVPVIIEITSHVSLFNAAGTPCTAQPVPVTGSRLPGTGDRRPLRT
jgi:hypothetical protein